MMPLPIGEYSAREYITPHYLNIVKATQYWVVENVKITRRFIASLKLDVQIDDLIFFELNEHTNPQELDQFLQNSIVNGDIAVTSDAGLPGMADPGSKAALWAHLNNISVQTLTGPGSIYLALCSSGFNGQQFVFHGYCPIKTEELGIFLKNISRHLSETGYTQIFMDTPYRANRLFEQICKSLPENTRLCMACAIHTQNESIRTKSIKEWKSMGMLPGKLPTVFILGM